MDAYTTALTLLSRRELSTAQLRARLARRKFEAAEIDEAIERLSSERTLDDKRVAIAAARTEGAVRRRGRRRAIQRVQQLGISADVAQAAVDEVFGEIDEPALLDQALDRKLKGADPRALDAKAAARVVRSLVAQGFDAGRVYARLRSRGARVTARRIGNARRTR
jgi:regulatory protein